MMGELEAEAEAGEVHFLLEKFKAFVVGSV
jgi:hypothetical protein